MNTVIRGIQCAERQSDLHTRSFIMYDFYYFIKITHFQRV